MRRAHCRQLLLLKLLTLEPQRPAVLHHRPHHILRHPRRHPRLDLDAHLYIRPNQCGQVLQNLLGNLAHIPPDSLSVELLHTVKPCRLPLRRGLGHGAAPRARTFEEPTLTSRISFGETTIGPYSPARDSWCATGLLFLRHPIRCELCSRHFGLYDDTR